MELWNTILLALLAPPLYYFSLIYRNYLEARKLGLPIVFIPVSNTNALWFLFSQQLHKFLCAIGLGRLTRLTFLGWDIHEKATPFIEIDTPAIVHVTPAGMWLQIADRTAAAQIFAAERKGAYERPNEGIRMLEVFGPNVSTTQGTQYKRMRRITANAFGETTMRTVWAETLRQGKGALRRWLEAGPEGTTTTGEDSTTLTLNVMLSAGFGKQYDFEEAQKKEVRVDKGGAMDYREAIKLVIENAMMVVGMGPKNLSRLARIFSGLKPMSTAVDTFQQYMADMIEDAGKEGQEPGARNNLLAVVSRASQENNMSQSEVFGNMFVFTFGGHDTTAHSLTFTFVLLSIHPEIQEWMREELRQVLKSNNPDDWTYDNFPKLLRVLAVQYETMRLYNPLLGIVKGVVPGHSQELSFENGHKIMLPGGTAFTLTTQAIHAHPKYWGEDAREWRPQRWIQTDENGVEQMHVPNDGRWLGWSDGVRACPGKKFGHIEHVAFMATLFYEHMVEPAREKGETYQQTKERIEDVLEDRGMTLTVHMWHPERAKLVWKKVA